jgi:hypothetical protein
MSLQWQWVCICGVQPPRTQGTEGEPGDHACHILDHAETGSRRRRAPVLGTRATSRLAQSPVTPSHDSGGAL